MRSSYHQGYQFLVLSMKPVAFDRTSDDLELDLSINFICQNHTSSSDT